MFKFLQTVLCIFLFMVLCLAAGSAYAEEGLVWPVQPKLMCKDWEAHDYTALRDVGIVSIWNTRDTLNIEIVPSVQMVLVFVHMGTGGKNNQPP